MSEHKQSDDHHHHHANEAHRPDGSINQLLVIQHTLEAVVRMLKGELVILKSDQQPVPGHPHQVDFSFRARVVPEVERANKQD